MGDARVRWDGEERRGVAGVTSDDLDAVLAHCRALWAGAEQVEAAGRARDGAVTGALVGWRGPLARTFAERATAEAEELAAVVRALRAEAEAWAGVWADTVNTVNRARREAQVAEVSGARSPGDDPGALVAPFTPVAVPSAATGFAPTGGLVWF